MTIYYVRATGGSDSNNGLSYAQAFATFNKFETVAAAGDTLRIAPGTYRQTWTTSVNGTNGNPITGVGDEGGTLTDGIGGEIRITGSDNDQTITRATEIVCNQNYRTFRGLHIDAFTSNGISVGNGASNVIIEQCAFRDVGVNGVPINVAGAGQNNNIIRKCLFVSPRAIAISFNHTANVDNTNHLVENCVFVGCQSGTGALATTRVGNITIRGSLFACVQVGIRVATAALTAGQTLTVNDCIFNDCGTALVGFTLGDIVEDYNTLFGNSTDRSTVNVGAHSVSYMPGFALPLLTLGVSPVFSGLLAPYSQIASLAGTNFPTDDLFGTVRANPSSWGAVQFVAGQRAYDAGYPRGGAE